MKKKYKSSIFIVFFLLFSLTGCQSIFDENISYSNIHADHEEIFLYNYSSQNIFKYNLEKKRTSSNLTKSDTIQYSFNDPTIEIFSSSSILKKDFRILKEENNSIQTLLTMPQNTAIYPLAKKDENNYFFQMYFFDTSGQEIKNKRQIILFNINDNHILPIGPTTGIDIENGIFIAPYLYFTDYNKLSETYRLNRINVNDQNALLEIDRQDLKTGDIYSDGKNIWLSDYKTIYLNHKYFPKKNYNYFYKGYLIQLTKHEDSMLLEVTNIDNGVILYSKDNILSFELEDNTIIIYGHKFIEQKYLF